MSKKISKEKRLRFKADAAILMDKARLIDADEKGGNLNKMKKIEHSNGENEDNSST
ncbi:MAG: hypothetical protein HY805_06835 [Nitrospirae bacterium]|nr:hypothetical protein [Nitrospirota bacterium]